MSNPSPDDLERLASRLAMLASLDGEADNAGRAVSQMVRRLGLSGGDIKQMFLAGAGKPIPKPQEKADTIAHKREVHDLEMALRQALTERDAARTELNNFKISQYNQRAKRRSRVALFVASVPIGLIAFIGVFMFGPDLSVSRAPQDLPRTAAIGAPSSGIVRSRAALLYRDPDRASPVLTTLSTGSTLTVHKLVWNMMSQWAEVQTGVGVGYVAVTDIELK